MVDPEPLQNAWVRHSVDYTVKAAVTGVDVYLWFPEAMANDCVLIDDVRVVRVP